MSYYYNANNNQNQYYNHYQYQQQQQPQQTQPTMLNNNIKNNIYYDSSQFKTLQYYSPNDYQLPGYLANKPRLTSDSLLSLSSQVDFANIEKKSSYRTSAAKSNENRGESTSLDLKNNNNNNSNRYDHEIHTTHNKKILLPDIWTDNKKLTNNIVNAAKKRPEKIQEFIVGKIYSNKSNSNSSLNLIEINNINNNKKEMRIKKMWKKVFN
jgi:hypothetical protein